MKFGRLTDQAADTETEMVKKKTQPQNFAPHNFILEFVIEEAVSDESFVLGKAVYSWKSIKHGKYAYAVGLMPRGLTIIKAGVGENKNRFNVNHTVHGIALETVGSFKKCC